MQHLDVVQSQLAGRMPDEADLLAVRIDQRELSVGIGKGERQPGKAGTRAEVSQPAAAQIRLQRQAVQQVMSQHILTPPDGREVVGPIPALDLIEQLQQPGRIALRQDDAETGCTVDQTLSDAGQ